MRPTALRGSRLPILLAAIALSVGCAGVRRPAVSPEAAALPPGQRWLDHFREELLPFWDQPDAWGEPRGAFPTFRCNDGRRLDPARPCPELAAAPSWIRENLGREFVRMRSRQTYLYGVAFHLTGEPRFLELARDGAGWIREHALEPGTGSAASWFEGAVGAPPVLERTSQDLAYAGLGLAMYWYLTRDEAVLADLLRLKEHVFTAYWDDRWGMLRWVAKEGHEEAGRQELVAQLDQVNAYLLLVAPLLPEPHRTAWRRELTTLAHLLVDRYFAPEQHLFWGTIQDAGGRALGARHVDFGHTAKALWMIERTGRLTGEEALVAFATREAAPLLARAYLPETGSWGSRPRPDGSVDAGKEWWIYAELDQLSATLALADPGQARHLPRTYDFWLRRFVDHQRGEVWGWVSPEGEPGRGAKIFQWKSGYHSAEHALVAYLTTQALRGEPATLHFALPGRDAEVRPYLFSGRAERVETSPLPGFPGREKVTVAFSGLR
jgi:mannose/cellobiose epimerase-like protein (N-acyl-D-glucosamine 2-epimerase family)